MSRIPELKDNTADTMFAWWKRMAAAGLAFHPDDDAFDVVNAATGKRVLTDLEAIEVNRIVHGLDGMHATHGDLIYQAVTQATEEPDITAARNLAISTWNDEDINVPPHAEVEKVDGGYWVEAQVWVSAE